MNDTAIHGIGFARSLMISMFMEEVHVRRLDLLVCAGAIKYGDEGDEDEYWPIKWVGAPWKLNEDTEFGSDESDPPLQAQKGEYVCRAVYLNKEYSQWYAEGDVPAKLVVRMQQVLLSDVTMEGTSQLPGNTEANVRRQLEDRNVMRVLEDDENEIIDEMYRRSCLDYVEDFEVEEEEEEDEDGEDNDNTDDDESDVEEDNDNNEDSDEE